MPDRWLYGVHYQGRDFTIWYDSADEARREAMRVEDKHAPAQLVALDLHNVQRFGTFYYHGTAHSHAEAERDGMLVEIPCDGCAGVGHNNFATCIQCNGTGKPTPHNTSIEESQ